MNHHKKESRKISVSYKIPQSLDRNKETVFLFEDALDRYFLEGVRLKEIQEEFNLVYILGRKHSETLLEFIQSSGDIDWSKAYQLLNIDQNARDLEWIRRELMGEGKIHLMGFSGSAGIMHYYLSLFPDRIKSFISFNPLLFDLQKNLIFMDPGHHIAFGDHIPRGPHVMDFAWYFNSSNTSKPKAERTHNHQSVQIEFLRWQFIFPGTASIKATDIALKVRLFEHSFGSQHGRDFSTPASQTVGWMKEESSELWSLFEKNPFDVFGFQFDKGYDFKGKLLLVGSAFDCLLNPRSYEVLAEFYPNTTLILIKDGHSMLRFSSTVYQERLIRSFLNDNTKEKIEHYKKIQKNGLLYEVRMLR